MADRKEVVVVGTRGDEVPRPDASFRYRDWRPQYQIRVWHVLILIVLTAVATAALTGRYETVRCQAFGCWVLDNWTGDIRARPVK